MDVKEKIQELEIRKEKIEIFAKEMIAICNESIRNLRSQCPHESSYYVPDASGNNDSYYVCEQCGLERKRFSH